MFLIANSKKTKIIFIIDPRIFKIILQNPPQTHQKAIHSKLLQHNSNFVHRCLTVFYVVFLFFKCSEKIYCTKSKTHNSLMHKSLQHIIFLSTKRQTHYNIKHKNAKQHQTIANLYEMAIDLGLCF